MCAYRYDAATYKFGSACLRGSGAPDCRSTIPPTQVNDDQMKKYLLDTLSNIECSHPNCGILQAGDFNQLDVSQTTNYFRF